MKSKVVRGLIVVFIAFAVWIAYELTQMQSGLAKATELARFGLWGRARSALQGYLFLHPGDAEARLLMANLWVQDDGLPGFESAPQALVHLERIPPRIIRGRSSEDIERTFAVSDHAQARCRRKVVSGSDSQR